MDATQNQDVAAQIELTPSDAVKEFVAGGSLFSAGGIRALPQANDDLSREIGPNVYECMMRDPDVSSCVHLLVNFVLADGVSINSPVGEKDPRYGQANDIIDFCEFSIGRVKGFRQALETMITDALVFGNKVAEQTYELTVDNTKKQRLVLKYLKPKPRRTTAFVVDEFMNVLGLTYIRGAAPTDSVFGGAAIGGGFSTAALPLGLRVLPREKFVILTLRSKDNDPRGTSSLRPAYNAYNLKTLTYPEYLRFLIQYALASIIAKTSPTARSEQALDPDTGKPQTLPGGAPVMVSPTQALANALTRYRNGTFIIVPADTDIKPMEVKGEGRAFLQAFTQFGQEITRAILYQTLATREGIHGTKAESMQKMSVLDMLVWWLKGQVAEAIRDDILRPLVRYNFGDQAVDELLPIATLGDTERRDWSTDADAVKSLAPFVTDSQWRALTQQIGLPDPEEDEELPSRTIVSPVSSQQPTSPDGTNQPASDQPAAEPAQNDQKKKAASQ